ncbi:MAG: trigger factor [Bacteroidales bacterium]|nr:trigger factor [Bacteroidales bacterium]MDD2323453.1 trigger factor [Bacteroidales bacterium]MDD3010076.1 trigger factor [Bacteroidales bacterium]MDD3961563.1 trigger factor [Bacteroidales bacterium]MDY0285027.1 trigger factor [Bacteroidales bacterium]
MHITKESTGALTATLKIEIIEADYSEKVEKQLQDYRKKANIPGFRAGKVPMGIIKKLYEKAVISDEINKLLSEKIADYLTEEKLEVIGNPLPNLDKTGTIDLDQMKDFTYYFDLGIQPEINITLDNSIEVTYPTIKVEEEKIDEYIHNLQKRNGTVTAGDEAEEGDLLKCDFAQLDEEGNILENGIQNSASLPLDSIQLKTIKKKFIGKKVGEVVIFDPMNAIKNATDVAAMLNIDKEKASSLKSEFAASINEITRNKEAELNEDLFKKVYPQDQITTEKELRDRVKKDVSVSYSAESDRHFVNTCIDALIEKAGIELPEDFLKRWIMETNEEKITAGQLEEQFDSFLKSMRWNLIEKSLNNNHPELNITSDAIRNHIRELFLNGKEETDEMKERTKMIIDSLMQNKEQVKSIYDHLYEKALLHVFKTNLNVIEKELSYDEFVTLITKTYEK